MYRIFNKSKIAFTLAEVLITILIIGIITSLVIPEIINDTQNQEYYVLMKKNFSALSDATKRMILDNGGTFDGFFNNPNDMQNKFGNYLVFTKKCDAYVHGCFYSGTKAWKNLHGDYGWFDFTDYPTAIMNNGGLIRFALSTSDCSTKYGTKDPAEHTCGWIDVDVNGFKQPNVMGRDIFRFWITKSGIYPNGITNDYYSNRDVFCNKDNSHSYSGRGCAAKVLAGGIVD